MKLKNWWFDFLGGVVPPTVPRLEWKKMRKIKKDFVVDGASENTLNGLCAKKNAIPAWN